MTEPDPCPKCGELRRCRMSISVRSALVTERGVEWLPVESEQRWCLCRCRDVQVLERKPPGAWAWRAPRSESGRLDG